MIIALALLVAPVAGIASSIDFDIPALNPGTMTYAGGLAPLVGAGIAVDQVTGPGGVKYNVLGGLLTFTTGAFSGSTATEWDFGGGGVITVSGCVDADKDGGPCDAGDISGVLLTGTFTSALVTNLGNFAGAAFIDTKNPALLSLFGIHGGAFSGNFNIGVGAPGVTPKAFSVGVNSGVLQNVSAVPEPATLALLGTGLWGF